MHKPVKIGKINERIDQRAAVKFVIGKGENSTHLLSDVCWRHVTRPVQPPLDSVNYYRIEFLLLTI